MKKKTFFKDFLRGYASYFMLMYFLYFMMNLFNTSPIFVGTLGLDMKVRPVFPVFLTELAKSCTENHSIWAEPVGILATVVFALALLAVVLAFSENRRFARWSMWFLFIIVALDGAAILLSSLLSENLCKDYACAIAWKAALFTAFMTALYLFATKKRESQDEQTEKLCPKKSWRIAVAAISAIYYISQFVVPFADWILNIGIYESIGNRFVILPAAMIEIGTIGGRALTGGNILWFLAIIILQVLFAEVTSSNCKIVFRVAMALSAIFAIEATMLLAVWVCSPSHSELFYGALGILEAALAVFFGKYAHYLYRDILD